MIMRTLAAVLTLTILAITSTYADAQSAIPDFSMLIQQHCIKNSESNYDVLLACEKSQWQAVRKLQALAQIVVILKYYPTNLTALSICACGNGGLARSTIRMSTSI